MADRKLGNTQIAIIAVIVLIIPFIIVFQLTKADIVIDFTDEDRFDNICFLGESQCTYVMIFPDIELREDDTYWWILGENVWCEKIERNVAEPVADPVGVITEETEIKCNNVAMFDKNEWDFSDATITLEGQPTIYTFTKKG